LALWPPTVFPFCLDQIQPFLVPKVDPLPKLFGSLGLRLAMFGLDSVKSSVYFLLKSVEFFFSVGLGISLIFHLHV
jgi:hypothetical protein